MSDGPPGSEYTYDQGEIDYSGWGETTEILDCKNYPTCPSCDCDWIKNPRRKGRK